MIIAVIAGIAFGLIAPDLAKNFKVIGTMFVSLIKMMISPVIFCTIVLGIGSVRAAASVGKAGGLALTYFIVMSTFALAVGLLVGNLIEPGSGLDIEATAGEGAAFADKAEHGTGLVGFVQSIIPETVISSLTSGSVLQTLFVALLAGFAVQGMGKAGEPILRGIAHLQKLVFKMLTMILWVAPIGAFGAIAGVVGATGFEAVKQLAILMLAFYITCLLFIFVVLGAILRIGAGFNIWKLLKYLGRELLLIVATSSSESALPNLMRTMVLRVCVSLEPVGIVVPTGYSFNLDGTAIYLTMSAIFISDAMNKPLTLSEQIGLLVFMIIASKGAAGVSGAGIATLAAGLHAHRPELLDGVGVIVGIDRFMSEARALTNFSGNAVATILVGRWTNTLDVQRAHDVLDGKLPYIESTDDSDVHFSNPTVSNPAHATLQPTPQVDLTHYSK
ncbi:Aerobic C4-dicarboxylate transport protein [Corynebacterium pseudotuberculosis 267]|nr:Aerobic C4-dicarboxylate transport protein [Corynebacterium pseudotuberculosis 267]